MSTSTDAERVEIDRLMDGMEMAWGIIANASGGNWDKESPEWREAANRWRDEHWHAALDRNGYAHRDDLPARATSHAPGAGT